MQYVLFERSARQVCTSLKLVWTHPKMQIKLTQPGVFHHYQYSNPKCTGCLLLWGIKCDPLSQNEHKVARAAIQNYYRFKFFIMQALKWYMICAYCSLFCSAKIIILCWFSFVFYYFVTCLTDYISVCKLVTLHSFCGSRSHVGLCMWYAIS